MTSDFENQVSRELHLISRVAQAIAVYCMAGEKPPTLDDAKIVESLVGNSVATLREEIVNGQWQQTFEELKRK